MRLSRVLSCAALIVVTSVVSVNPPAALAGSGLNKFTWSAAGYTVSSTSYKYSNMSGFVQALVNSNGCSIPVDGIFGNVTTWNLAVAQNGILGTNNGGVMNTWSWNGFQNALDPFGLARLSSTTFTDAYGTQHRYYYGGGSLNAEFGWNPISSQWLFSQYPSSNPNLLVSATPSRTIGSVAACA
jgi:hypothetical protein